MLVNENGPGRVFFKLRKASGIEYSDMDEVVSFNDWTPLTCTHCTSVWAAVALSFIPSSLHKLLAASAASVLLDKLLERRDGES